MSKKNNPNIFLLFLCVLFLIIVAKNFVHYYVAKDYPLNVFTSCDPLVHSCFVADPDLSDPTFQGSPYAKVEISAAVAPHCLDEHNCENFTCEAIFRNCHITYCSDELVDEGESCSTNIQ